MSMFQAVISAEHAKAKQTSKSIRLYSMESRATDVLTALPSIELTVELMSLPIWLISVNSVVILIC